MKRTNIGLISAGFAGISEDRARHLVDNLVRPELDKFKDIENVTTGWNPEVKAFYERHPELKRSIGFMLNVEHDFHQERARDLAGKLPAPGVGEHIFMSPDPIAFFFQMVEAKGGVIAPVNKEHRWINTTENNEELVTGCLSTGDYLVERTPDETVTNSQVAHVINFTENPGRICDMLGVAKTHRNFELVQRVFAKNALIMGQDTHLYHAQNADVDGDAMNVKSNKELIEAKVENDINLRSMGLAPKTAIVVESVDDVIYCDKQYDEDEGLL